MISKKTISAVLILLFFAYLNDLERHLSSKILNYVQANQIVMVNSSKANYDILQNLFDYDIASVQIRYHK